VVPLARVTIAGLAAAVTSEAGIGEATAVAFAPPLARVLTLFPPDRDARSAVAAPAGRAVVALALSRAVITAKSTRNVASAITARGKA
jgi:hypothetical protein